MTDGQPRVGQIWIARGDQTPDLYLLIIEVHDVHVQVLLCGSEYASATEKDAVLRPSLTGMPEHLLVHGDISAPVLTTRLCESVGSVDPEIVERIVLRGRGLDFTSSDLGRGRAIISDDDPRSDWKLAKHKQLRNIRARASELGFQMRGLGDA